jgi:hypothetical protein
VTTLSDCDDITPFDGTLSLIRWLFTSVLAQQWVAEDLDGTTSYKTIS